jgi:secreted PhoX family phosphatase
VSNSEFVPGGAGALRFDADGNVVDAYAILQNTIINCAGGATPYGTWLSCEETPSGRVFECDPSGENAAVERPALGVFQHEAVAYDPVRHHLYLTEDAGDGRLYRFVPETLNAAGFADLAAGRLEVAQVLDDGGVIWHELSDPTGATPTRQQVAESTAFRGGEGIAYFDNVIYFSTKGDNRVWAYNLESETISVLYDAATAQNPILTGVDNVTVTCCGDVLVAEDGGDMQIVAILGDGTLKPLMQVVGHDGSEVTGPAFDPSGTRLYFSSQRGGTRGITYEISGPFHVRS